MTRKTVQVAVAGTVVGLALLGASFLLARNSGPGWGADWVSGVLVEAGAAVLFLVPLYWITRSLDRHIEEVREQTIASVDQVRSETSSSVEELAGRVETFEADVDRRLADIASAVSERLNEERQHEQALRTAIRESPTQQGLSELLTSAYSRGLIDRRRPPRVQATTNEWGFYIGVVLDAGEFWDSAPDLSFQVEQFNGAVVDRIYWSESETIEDVMVRVANVLDRETGMPLAIEGLFTGLSDLLEVAGTDPLRRPIVQLCPPLWAVTTTHVVTYGKRLYGLLHEQLRSDRIHLDMAGKSWSNEDSFELAQGVALGLFRPRDPNEPPF